MKKFGLIILLLLLFFNAFAVVPQRLIIGLGNDMFSFGFSRNDDDQLSYSEVVGIASDRWDVKLFLDSVTNRGWKDSWDVTNETIKCDPSDEWYNGRYDSIKLLGSYSFDFLLGENFEFSLSPKIGLAFAGNANLQYFQNWTHELRKIHPVYIPYDSSNVKVLTMFGGQLDFTYDFYRFENNILKLSAQADIIATQKFRAEECFSLNIALANNLTIPFTLNLGYSINQSFSDSKTEKLFSEHLNGYRLGFKVDTGLFAVEYFNSILSDYGYGIITVDPMCFLRDPNWKETNSSFYIGTKTCFVDLYTSIAFEYKINQKWSVFFEDSNVSGQPLDTVDELLADFEKEPRRKKNNSFFLFGGKYFFELKDAEGWLTPYLSASVGFARWRQTDLTNTIKDSSYPSNVNVDYLSPLTDFSVGALIFPEGLLTSDITAFQLNVYGGIMYLPILKNDYPKGSKISPVIGIGLKAGIDI